MPAVHLIAETKRAAGFSATLSLSGQDRPWRSPAVTIPTIIPGAVGVCSANDAPVPGAIVAWSIVARPVSAIVSRSVAVVVRWGIATVITWRVAAIIAVTRPIRVGTWCYATDHCRSH